MNREIKFRVWNATLKKMVYANEDDTADFWDGVNLSYVDMVNSLLRNDKNGRGEKYKWMQFVGLEDKNGKEIYEGDILKGINDGDISVVIFKNGCFLLQNDERPWTIWEQCKTQEIIGNIYENPELINADNSTEL